MHGSCGGAAILLSNKVVDGFRAKYKLLHAIRTQNASDESLNCVVQQEDTDGNRGVHLSKDITTVAGRALTTNLTMLGYVTFIVCVCVGVCVCVCDCVCASLFRGGSKESFSLSSIVCDV